ncbi:MAG TPA: lipopolysaccharide biosynthesis protein [Bacteroidetes bacterium]|nr:lipopolysaccharide biosynthesis protein [Bacteroidota bacterium]
MTPAFPKIIRNLGWRSAGLIAKIGLQVLTVAVLARMLPIEAFGTITYVMIFVNFTELLFQMGIGPAVVQKKKLAGSTVRTAVTLAVIAGAAGTLVFQLASSLLVDEVVRPVYFWLGFIFLFSGFGAVSEALLQRRGDFKYLMLAETAAYFCGYTVVTIVLAARGFGVMSLVAGIILQGGLRALLLWLGTRHSLIPAWQKKDVRELASFGGGLTLSRIANFVAMNGDYFIAGRVLGEKALGLYSRAFYLMRLPTSLIMTSLHSVLFPAFAHDQHDTHRLQQQYFTSVMLSATLVLPMVIFISFMAEELVLLVLGEKWLAVVPALKILAPVGFFNLYTLSDALLKAVGAIRRQMAGHIVFALLLLGGVVIGSGYGITGIAAAVLAANGFMFLFMAAASRSVLQARWGKYVIALRPALLLGGASYALLIAMRPWLAAMHFLQALFWAAVFLIIVMAATAMLLRALLPDFRKATGRIFKQAE